MNLDADDPYEILGTTPDATETEVRVAAGKAKRELNPDHFPDEEKTAARRKLYRVREAERAILENRPMDQSVGQPSGRGRNGDTGAAARDDEQSNTSQESPTAELSVSFTPEPVTAGATVSFHVVDGNGEPVREAAVSVAGQTLSTDASGVASTTLDEPGTVRVRATKTESTVRYEPATATISVRPGSDDIDLGFPADVETDRSGRLRVAAGTSVTVEATDSATGRAVTGATVEIETAGQTEPEGGPEARSTKTDADGRATVTFSEPGRAVLRATDGDTVSEEVAVVVRRGDGGWQSETGSEPGGVAGREVGRLVARAVGILVLVGLSGLIGLIAVSDGIPIVVVAGGGGAVAVGLLVYLWLVAR